MGAMIVAPQPLAAEEGIEVLRRGGNAVDAAVTTALVQGVVDPQMCGIGGGGVMLVREPVSTDVVVFEFYPRAGSGVSDDMWADSALFSESALRYPLAGGSNDFGYQSIAVPGTVRGLSAALDRFGTISWEQALAPAIATAREGFPVTGFMREYWESDSGPGCLPHHERMQVTAEARRIFTPRRGPVRRR